MPHVSSGGPLGPPLTASESAPHTPPDHDSSADAAFFECLSASMLEGSSPPLEQNMPAIIQHLSPLAKMNSSVDP